jgi:glyoxylase-like metal-dependent hydrolase (beta-lactamase superfamily II)
MSRLIDCMHLGHDRVIGAYEVDGMVVDPGPSTCVDTLLEGLGGEHPRALLLTHIHLDHAGATGVLVRRFPEITVYVHERGAPHLIDPSKLLASASQLYGDDMERLWGEVAPVPEENIRRLEGGESLEGFRVAYTPGHASHHVAYLHVDTGEAFVGDVGGVRIPPIEHTIAPTPPPDIDVEAWGESLDAVAAWSPTSLGLTHFGRSDDPEAQIERVRQSLSEYARRARESDEATFIAALEKDLRAAGEEVADQVRQAAPPKQMWLGLERYWRKREAATAGEAGGAR